MQSLIRMVTLVVALHSGLVLGQTLVCAADLNGDGSVDSPGEQATCTTYASGSVCPLQAQRCTVDSTGTPSCPGTPSAACVNTGAGVFMCSRNACVDPSTVEKTVTTVAATPVPSNSGPVSSTGACLGTITIFPGTGATCRGVGVETQFTNCCNSSNAMHDTLGQPGGNSQLSTLSSGLTSVEQLIVPHCMPSDEATDFQNNSGQCVYLGDYCAESWPVVGCVQKDRSYCCFNSMLARIIQQQGRPQLNTFPNGFGTPTAPNCRGFTPQEFQSLDFSKIDLSEYTAQIQTNSQQNIQSTLNGTATQQLSGH